MEYLDKYPCNSQKWLGNIGILPFRIAFISLIYSAFWAESPRARFRTGRLGVGREPPYPEDVGFPQRSERMCCMITALAVWTTQALTAVAGLAHHLFG